MRLRAYGSITDNGDDYIWLALFADVDAIDVPLEETLKASCIERSRVLDVQSDIESIGSAPLWRGDLIALGPSSPSTYRERPAKLPVPVEQPSDGVGVFLHNP
jgi:hypothetical protein